MLLLLALAAAAPENSHDVEQTVAAMNAYEQTARADLGKAPEAALGVCRLAMSQSLRGIGRTAKAIRDYRGAGMEILTFECQGYMQGGYDALHLQRK
jgi:hypothetical protein